MLLTTYSALLFVMAGLLAVVGLMIWSRRSAPGGVPLFAFIFSVAVWALATGLEASAVSLSDKLTFSKFQYLGIAPSSVLLLWFADEFSHQEHLKPHRSYLLFWVIPLLTVLATMTNERHWLFWTSITPSPEPGSNLAVYGHGLLFWLNVVYYYALLATASVFVIQTTLRFRHRYRYQAMAVLVSIPLPWLGNVIYIFNLGNPGEDLTVFGFGIAGMILAGALRRLQLFDLVPVARDRVIEWMDNCLVVIDRQNRVVDVNPAMTRMMARIKAGAAAPTPRGLIGQPLESAFWQMPVLVDCMQRGADGRYELTIRGEDGAFAMEMRVSAILDPMRGQVGRMAILHDITDLKQAREAALEARDRALTVAEENTALYEQMRQMALTDPLTGLSTRRHFFNLAASIFENTRQGGRPLAVIMLDLDHFKQINDQFGHATGDRMLQAVARTCQDALRKADIIGRYGGEEFIVALPETDRAHSLMVAERLRERVEKINLDCSQGQVRVTLSVGVAQFNGLEDSLEKMIERADRGMYVAKQAGRNRVSLYEG